MWPSAESSPAVECSDPVTQFRVAVAGWLAGWLAAAAAAAGVSLDVSLYSDTFTFVMSAAATKSQIHKYNKHRPKRCCLLYVADAVWCFCIVFTIIFQCWCHVTNETWFNQVSSNLNFTQYNVFLLNLKPDSPWIRNWICWMKCLCCVVVTLVAMTMVSTQRVRSQLVSTTDINMNWATSTSNSGSQSHLLTYFVILTIISLQSASAHST